MTPSLISSEHGNRPSDPAAYGNESQGHNYAANAAPSNDANQSGQPSQDTLISWAKRVVAHDMGLKDESLLDDKFYFIGPFDGPVGKRAFIDGSKTFDLRGAFPDFDFQAHDFRVDEVERTRVWFTTRKKGTHKGDLPMYGKIIKATNRTLDFPPEGYSVTFNPAGRVTKLTGGFVMDATQGNSSGLGGPLGIAAAVGHPQPAYTHQPPATAIKSCCLPIGDNVQEWIHNNFPSVAPSPHPRPSNPPHAPGTGARAGSAPQSQPPPQQQQARGQQYTADTTHPPVAQPITNDGQYLSQPPPPPQNQGKDAHPPPPQPQQPQQPPNPPSGQPPAQSHPFLGGIFDQIFDFSTLTGLTGMLGGGNRQEQQRPTHYAQVTGDEHPPLDTSQSQGKDAHGRPIFAQIADPNSAPAPAHVETPQEARVGDHGNEGGKEDMGQRLPDSERAVSPEQVQQEAQWHPLPQPPTTHVQSQELLQLAYTIFVQESQANLADAPQQRLAQNFEYFEPLSGLMDKASYTEKYGPLNLKASFPDLRILTYNYRIDAFRPGVVWFDMRLSGTQNGAAFGDIPAKTGHSYQSPPEAVSLAFNDQKQILRATAGAILDREEGNTGGLGGLHGIRYAMGRPSNPLFTRPFRFHKKDEWKRYSTSTLSPFVDKVHSWKNHQLNPQQQQQQQHNTPPSHPSQPHQQDQPTSSGDPTGSTTQAGQQQQPGGGGYTHGSQLNVKRPTEGQGPAGSRPGYGGDDVYAHSGNASGYGGTATQSAYGGQGGYGSSFQNPPAYAPHAGTPSQQQPQGHMGGYPSHVTGGTYT